MSDKRKISVVVLGTADYLKTSLISVILGRDKFARRNTLKKIKTHENDTYEVTYTPNMYDASEDIRKLFSSKHPDMCLLVIEDEVPPEDVQQQIEKLHKITGKPREKFSVLLPLGYKHKKRYPFKFYTVEELFKKLRKLTKKRRLLPTNKRSADQPPTQMRTGGRYVIEFFTDPKKSSKGNHSDNKLNLVLLGMSGTGKSASGNTILGKKQFLSRVSSKPVTTECQVEETEINGTRVRVIDTPDIFDDEIKSSVKNQHVKKCKQFLQSGPCVFLLVIHVSRFTDGERDILRKFEKAFGSGAKEQTVILFTRGEDLQRANMSLEDFLQDCQPELMNIVDQCGRRCVVFENKASHQRQVTELMQTVIRVLNKYQNQ